MEKLDLIAPSLEDAERVKEYRASFPRDRKRVTLNEERIPGLDHLEEFETVEAWLRFTDEMRGKISWFMTLRKPDQKAVGFVCIRHALRYDDDTGDFSSHIGYSIRPEERGKGYGKEQLRLALIKAREIGLRRVRIICVDTNERSKKTILGNGGVMLDQLRGEESGLTVCRFDVSL